MADEQNPKVILQMKDGNQIEILTGNKDSARIIGGLTL